MKSLHKIIFYKLCNQNVCELNNTLVSKVRFQEVLL